MNSKTGIIDLGERYPPLRKYWPNLQSASPQQTAYLLLDHEEALYGGAAGGGKSDALLADALKYVDHSKYAALILRRTFPQLNLPGAIMDRSREWLTPTDARWNEDSKKWTFPSGATLTFGFCESDNDVYRYQGPEFQFVGFDELTQFSERQYVYFFSRVRKLKTATVPIRMRAASNPGGVGHGWVLNRFPIKTGESPKSKEGRIFIPAKVADNPGLDVDEYVKSLERLDDTLRKQLLEGDWGAFEGMAFLRFRTETHVVPTMRIPRAWERFECMDFGLNNPTSWAVVAVDYDGNLIFYDSFYEPGLPSTTAPAILHRRKPFEQGGAGWEARDKDGWGGRNDAYADPSINSRTGTMTRWGEDATIATEFLENGVTLLLANNDPKAGYARLRELIEPDADRMFPLWHPLAGRKGSPRLFVVRDGDGVRTRGCPELVDQLSTAPVQPEDKRDAGEKIDPDWESKYGHAVAMARYGVMSRPDASDVPSPPPPDPRAGRLAEYEKRVERGHQDERAYQHV